ncbi:MAG: hypothetical protein KAJ24_04015 [Candidatus Aenigmarchaeota archaeon]|nr:hypothetical protein [Candidatus Aenigmarchaeota archaeon]
MLSFKQQRIIDIAKKNGSISIQEVEKIYPHINQRKNSVGSLEILGFLKKRPHGWDYKEPISRTK